ncbi:diguanylate cyclase domain-containing protein [Noviherbaspirillum sp. UKPF54]|uniref:sensor domain-containing diguanylate cyclase n=1 Tax=Noviherbaspirillum sp. UKPF54 TaxID=2601898 RepID=UPI0011B12742|nr:diguanylate cyclase [Noviherbaspirillum sp. UKPF54]QDZ28248.1 diguanylate cyclase [Noviherbaspirillum sp. UKPF54]
MQLALVSRPNRKHLKMHLSAINERLILALESSRQMAFDWHIPDDKLYVCGEPMESFIDSLLEPGTAWRSSTLPAIIHNDDQENFRRQLRDALKGTAGTDGAFYKAELRLRDSQHTWRWVNISGKIIERDRNGQAVRMVGTFSDIDERKQNERKIARLRDLYATLSQTNQAIVRIGERDALFREICRIAVEHGRFHMAWIGLIDHTSKQVISVASYGKNPDALQHLSVSVDDSKPEGCGVIGMALRENRPNICNDLYSTPHPSHRLKAANEAEYQSLASFPFHIAGKTLGALNLYSAEKDFFDEQLIELLEEMALDISFAIENYEREAQRKAIEAALVDSERFKSAILTAALDCIVSINRKGEIISFNEAAERTFGYSRDQVLGKPLVDTIIPQEWRDRHQPAVERFLSNGTSTMLNRRVELTAMRSDGTIFPVELAVVPLSVANEPIFTAFIRDISELKQSQAILKDSAMRYRQLVELSPEAIFVYRDGKLALLNQAGGRMLGTADTARLLGRSIFDFIHPDYHALFQERARLAPASLPSTPFIEQIWLRMDGSRFNAEIAATNLMYNDEPAVQVVVRDITERKRTESLQLGQNRILNMVATGVALPEILLEIARFVESQSDHGLCSIMQLNGDGSALTDRIAPSLPQTYLSRLADSKVGPANCSCGTAVFRAAPVIVTDIATDPLWESRRDLALAHGLRACTSWPIFGKNKKILGTFALYFMEPSAPSARDLQLFNICTNLAGIAIEGRASEEKIRYLAHYDGLTSLPNRFLFKEYLDLALRNAKRHGKKFAVFFLDLDKFKEINDTLGHDAGDHVLREVAARLRNCLRHTDKIARMGGDEFYVLIEDLGDGRYAADVAQKLLDAALRPVRVADRDCQLSVSIGISIFPDDGNDELTLLKNADSAMYRAKDRGKNAYEFFSPHLEFGEEKLDMFKQHLMAHLKESETTYYS